MNVVHCVVAGINFLSYSLASRSEIVNVVQL